MSQIRWDGLSEARQLARLGKSLSRAAQTRLQWMLFYLFNGRNAARTCRYFGISRQTFYRWLRRIGRATYVGPPGQPQQLSVCSRCANNIPAGARTSSWCCSLVRSSLFRFPWSAAFCPFLSVAVYCTSLLNPRSCCDSTANCENVRGPFASLNTGPSCIPEIWWRSIPRKFACAAARFLDTLLERFPFPVKALQVDGGSEFAAEFELACQQKQLPLFVLPPKSPKLNAHVERSHRTHHEEFYQVHADSDQPLRLNHQLRHWEHTYNCVRPHQSLAYLTPLEFVTRWKLHRRKAKCH